MYQALAVIVPHYSQSEDLSEFYQHRQCLNCKENDGPIANQWEFDPFFI